MSDTDAQGYIPRQPRYSYTQGSQPPPTPALSSGDQLLAAYARGERKFTYWRLAGAFLHGADLRDVNLYGSDLSGADLTGADLSRANLGKADLYNANLSGANLSGTFYEGANFARANMTGIVTDNPSLAILANQPGGVGGGYTANWR